MYWAMLLRMGAPGDAWTLGHRPALDGLRGVAVLLVLVDHSLLGWFVAAGSTGVGMFFVLSGFLITTLLLDNHETTGRIDLRGFYRRRMVRLVPALAVFLVVMVSIGLVSRSAATGVFLYSANWFAVAGVDMGGAGHMWSLAVEEQFYLVWPLLLIALSRLSRRTLAWLCAAGIVASLLARFALWDPHDVTRAYVGTDANASGLLLGCLIAVIVRERRMSGSAARFLVPFAFVGLAASALSGHGVGGWLMAPAFAPFFTAVVLYGVVSNQKSAAWLSTPWLSLFGRRSYALYLWHFPLLIIVTPMVPSAWHWPAVVGFLGLSWLLALASWRYVEAPCMAKFRAPESLGTYSSTVKVRPPTAAP